MNAYTARKLAEFAASLLILIPCVVLLAWESNLPDPAFLWFVLLVCSGTVLAALYVAEKRQNGMNVKRFISKCGGFCIMVFFIAYQFATIV